MKYFIFFLTTLLLFSCNKREDSEQKIDQIVHLYIKNADGTDGLNPKNKKAYTSISLQDLNGDRSLQSINSYSLLYDKDSVRYIEYVAGARRILKDSTSPSQKTYQSDFILNLSRTVNSVLVTDADTVSLQYSWSPTLFALTKVAYNQKTQTLSKSNGANTISVTK